MPKPLYTKKWLIVAALAAVTVFSFFYAGKIVVRISQAQAQASGKPNVLVLSVCSMRKDLFSVYGREGEAVMPAAERFFDESSIVFEKAFNGVPWISFVAFIERYFPLLTAQGLLSASPWREIPFIRVPMQKNMELAMQKVSVDPDTVNDSVFEKDYKSYAELVREQILLPRLAPFVLIVHIKYLHYPLIDRYNADSEWDFYLTAGEKARVKEYLSNPEKYHRKLPLLLMLALDPRHALAHPEVRAHLGQREVTAKTLRSLSGLVTNPKFLREWQESEGYAQDLEILKKAYAGNARHLDKMLEPMMNLYGRKDLQKNTVVVLTGDHGESHMERGVLTHAESGFDESLAIPAAIRFPSDWRPQVRVKEQFHIQRIADFVEGILDGQVNRANAGEHLKKLEEDVFIFRDCRHTLRGLRFKNRYKYVVNSESGERQLYDLEKDPGELVNIASEAPDVADRMEALYWENLSRFNWVTPYRCAPW